MKKIVCILFCALILLSLCACGKQQAELKEPTNFYYINKDISYNSPTGVISAEVREGITFHGNFASFLRAYLQGPESSDLQTYIPAETKLISCAIKGDEVVLTFNEEFSKLSGVKLSAASSALLMSIHDYAGINTLTIRVEHGRLDDKDELRLTLDDIVLMDSVQINEP